MGRDAHLLRLALGRSADELPDWSSLADQYAAQGDHYVGIDPSKTSYGKWFDKKGRAYNPASRGFNKKFCDAQNDVLSLALFWDETNDATQTASQFTESKERVDRQKREERVASLLVGTRILADLDSYFIGNVDSQLQVFRSFKDVPLTQLFRVQYSRFGFTSFFLAGLLWDGLPLVYAVMSEAIIGMQKGKDSDGLSSRSFTESSNLISWLGYRSFEYLLFVPLLTYHELQRLHLLPSTPLGPPLESLNPFSMLSPVYFGTMGSIYMASAASILLHYYFKHHVVDALFNWVTQEPGFSLDVIPTMDSNDMPFFAKTYWHPLLRLGNFVARKARGACDRLEDIFLLKSAEEPRCKDSKPDGPSKKLNAVVAETARAMLNERFTEILCRPVRGIMLRTIASAFVSSALPGQQLIYASWFKADMYPIFVPPIQGLAIRNLRSDARYWGKVATTIGMKLAFDLGFCCLQGGAALWLGRNYFDWRL